MDRELLLLRHAKSDWIDGVSDFERPITANAMKAAVWTGKWLHSRQLVPDHIVASPAVRTRTTADAVATAFPGDANDVHIDARIYEARYQTLIEVLADCPANALRILLVGHNPGLAQLAAYLAVDNPIRKHEKSMTTCMLWRFGVSDNWDSLEQQQAAVLQIVDGKRQSVKDFTTPE